MLSIIYYIIVTVWTVVAAVALLPLTLMPRRFHYLIPRIWCGGMVAALKICGITYRVEGLHNLPSAPFIIASRHQSAFETLAYSLIFKMPAFVLKQELLKLPLIGFYLRKVGMIAIDRKAGVKSLEQIISQGRACINEGRNIIIFPEGTRTKPDERRKLNRGVYALWKDLKIPVVPVSLNSGHFWAKNGISKKAGEIVLSFHTMIPSNTDLSADEFMAKLEEAIYN